MFFSKRNLRREREENVSNFEGQTYCAHCLTIEIFPYDSGIYCTYKLTIMTLFMVSFSVQVSWFGAVDLGLLIKFSLNFTYEALRGTNSNVIHV